MTTPLGGGPDVCVSVLIRVIEEFSRPGDRVLLDVDDTAFLDRLTADIRDRVITRIPHRPATHSDNNGNSDRQALIVTLHPPRRPVDIDSYRRWAGLLTARGVLVVITTSPAGAGRFHNRPGSLVRAAHACGLVYLQHIVASHLQDRPPVATPAPDPPPPPSHDPPLHAPAHFDLLAFVRHDHQESR